jgi:hypothetical protein
VTAVTAFNRTALAGGDNLSATAMCPSTQPYAIGGGADASSEEVGAPVTGPAGDHPVFNSDGTPDGWEVTSIDDAPIRAYAICSQ